MVRLSAHSKLPILRPFENSTECMKISFDSDFLVLTAQTKSIVMLKDFVCFPDFVTLLQDYCPLARRRRYHVIHAEHFRFVSLFGGTL